MTGLPCPRCWRIVGWIEKDGNALRRTCQFCALTWVIAFPEKR